MPPVFARGGHQEPRYRLLADGQDISTRLQGRVLSLTLAENRGFEADQLDLEIDDSDGRVSMPRRGSKLTLSLGWAATGLVDKGTFTVDETGHGGVPDKITIRARSADMRGGFTAKRERSFHQKTLGDIVRTIAQPYGLTPLIQNDLQTEWIDHLDQTDESDANLLTRLAEMFDAIATVKQGRLLFLRSGKAMSASGLALPAVTITRASGDGHNFNIADRDSFAGVKANYYDTKAGKKEEVIVYVPADEDTSQDTETPQASEENLKVLRHTYANKANAERAAKAEVNRLQRGVATFSINLAIGRPELFPELPATIRGWKPEIDSASWILKRTTHSYSDSGGLKTALELEVRASDV